MSTQACFKIHLIYLEASPLTYLMELMFMLILLILDICLMKPGKPFLSTPCGLILGRNLSLFLDTQGKVMSPVIICLKFHFLLEGLFILYSEVIEVRDDLW